LILVIPISILSPIMSAVITGETGLQGAYHIILKMTVGLVFLAIVAVAAYCSKSFIKYLKFH
jgi:hypothetical protein